MYIGPPTLPRQNIRLHICSARDLDTNEHIPYLSGSMPSRPSSLTSTHSGVKLHLGLGTAGQYGSGSIAVGHCTEAHQQDQDQDQSPDEHLNLKVDHWPRRFLEESTQMRYSSGES